MKTQSLALRLLGSGASLSLATSFASLFVLLSLCGCGDPAVDGGGGSGAGRSSSSAHAAGEGGGGAQGTGGSTGAGPADASSAASGVASASSSSGAATSTTATTSSSTSGGSSSSAGACDLNQTAEEVVLGCAEGVCAASWAAMTSCQAGCGVFPTASCMQQNCIDEVLAFSQCLSTCPEYVACDPCLLACINLKNCGFTSLAACYATCPATADDAVWACGASMVCDVVPMCPELQGL